MRWKVAPQTRWGVAMAFPALAGFALLTVLPVANAALTSLTGWQAGGDPTFIGLQNFRELAADPLVSKSIGVTLYFALGAMSLTLILGLGLAILLSKRLPGTAVFRTIYYLPVLMPSVANAILWLWVFQPEFGLFNGVLKSLGFHGPNWLGDPHTVIPSLVLMNGWACGNMMIIFVAGLRQIPVDLYEAVAIDGGGGWAQFRHVTIPMISPVIFFNLIIGLLGFLQVFSEAYIMTGGGPANGSLFFIFFLWQTAFTEGRLGYASAVTLPFIVLIVALIAIIYFIGRRLVYYSGAR